MLVIEKENIVIDVNKRESQSPESCWLVFDTTIQINWRLKRTSFDVRTTYSLPSNTNTIQTWTVNWRNAVDWSDIYVPLQIFKDLWYDVWATANEIMQSALQEYFWTVRTGIQWISTNK